MNPLVSLVTPFFNAMPYFRDYLSSVAGQTWRPLELIAVDDGSTDGSWECLQEFLPVLKEAGISVYPLQIVHSGQAAAFNEALPLVTGEYLTWCDADDRMTADSIEKKAEYLNQFPEIGMVRSDGFVIDGDTGRSLCSSARDADRFTQNIFDALFQGTTYCYAGCYMLRTDLFFSCYPEKKIPLSPEGQNLQLLLPPASRSECGFVPLPLHYYCMRGSGHSSRKRSFSEANARLDNFSKLRREILKSCICDEAFYLEEDSRLTREAKKALVRSAADRARKERRSESRNSDIS